MTDLGIDALTELTLNLRWAWHHGTDELWAELDPELWALTHNPWVVLQTVSRSKLRDLLARPEYRTRVTSLRAATEPLPGLAGLVPAEARAVAVDARRLLQHGIRAQRGPTHLFRWAWQRGGRSAQGGQRSRRPGRGRRPALSAGVLPAGDRRRRQPGGALSSTTRRRQLRISPVRDESGEWIRVPIELPGIKVLVPSLAGESWPARARPSRQQRSGQPSGGARRRQRAHGGGPLSFVLRQELVLGIVGWRLLRALRLEPEVCHLNEGHAAFAALERARSFMEDNRCGFDVALAVTRAGNLFTTHTPVPAGFDRFAPEPDRPLPAAICRGWPGSERS